MTFKKAAADAYADAWDYLELDERTEDQRAEMVTKAHAALSLRELSGGTASERAQSKWLISRVYAVIGEANLALLYAQKGMNLCNERRLGDLDLAFAFEAVARAYRLIGDAVLADENLKNAREFAEKVTDDADREFVLEQINN